MDSLHMKTLKQFNDDRTGKRFERLTVIGIDSREKYQTYWMCACDCGNHKIVEGGKLRNGDTRSCGCLRAETTSRRSFKHGDCNNTKLYGVWASIIARTENKNSKAFKYYGLKGVRMCHEWRVNFQSFKDYMLSIGYREGEGLSIDRDPNQSGNYEPGNVRIANQVQQMRNTSRNRLLTYNGITATASEWSEKLGFKSHTLLARIDKCGWSVEKAITTPLKVQ